MNDIYFSLIVLAIYLVIYFVLNLIIKSKIPDKTKRKTFKKQYEFSRGMGYMSAPFFMLPVFIHLIKREPTHVADSNVNLYYILFIVNCILMIVVALNFIPMFKDLYSREVFKTVNDSPEDTTTIN